MQNPSLKIIKSSVFDTSLEKDFNTLIEECEVLDKIKPLSFTDNDYNEDPDFPCFRYIYDESQKMLSFISVFIPGDGSAEVYGMTSPEFRKHGYFSLLINELLAELEGIGIVKVLFPSTPKHLIFEQIANQKNLTRDYTEFILKFKKDYVIQPEFGELKLKVCMCDADPLAEILGEVNDSSSISYQYDLLLDNEIIGGCQVEFNESYSHASIFDVYIEEKLRGRGYGHKGLMLILDYITKNHTDNIILQLHGDNAAASALYLHNGFEIDSQLDYWLF